MEVLCLRVCVCVCVCVCVRSCYLNIVVLSPYSQVLPIINMMLLEMALLQLGALSLGQHLDPMNVVNSVMFLNRVIFAHNSPLLQFVKGKGMVPPADEHSS